MDKKSITPKILDTDKVFFLPDEYIWAVENIYNKMQCAQQELHFVVKEMNKPSD